MKRSGMRGWIDSHSRILLRSIRATVAKGQPSVDVAMAVSLVGVAAFCLLHTS